MQTLRSKCYLTLLAVVVSCGIGGSPSSAAEPQLFYDATALNGAIDSGAVIVLDTRTQDDYQAGHIPGARWVDVNAWRDLGATETGLTDEPAWAAQLGALGISPETTLVVAGESLPEVARVWWLLRYLGMPRVAVLDGGMAAWTNSGFPVSQAAPQFSVTQPKIAIQSQQLASLAALTAPAQAKPPFTILDTRSEAEFTGARGVGTRTGHIPGAKHFEWTRFVDASGKMLAADEIKHRLKEAGIDITQPVVAHCQTGGRSSVAILALEWAGAADAKNYYRGWSEYSGVLTAPVEK